MPAHRTSQPSLEGGADRYVVQTGTATPAQYVSIGHNMFCPGTTNLADGRILVNGGSSNPAHRRTPPHVPPVVAIVAKSRSSVDVPNERARRA
jgi:hypothetical protein